MLKVLFNLLILSAVVIISGCSVIESSYSPSNDYVYSVGYYGYQPAYDRRYYSGVVRGDNYWYGYRAVNGHRGWYERRW